MRFILEQSDGSLTTHSGLSLLGLLFDKVHVRERLNATTFADLQAPDISHADVVLSYLGLLAQGKSDFEHIEPFRQDEFFTAALGCHLVPSAPTLRQRFDAAQHQQWETILREEAVALLKKAKVTLTPTHGGRIPFDADVSPFDNSGSSKEGVELTYKKIPGYAPIFFYLGQEGYLLDLELRAGSTHSQAGDWLGLSSQRRAAVGPLGCRQRQSRKHPSLSRCRSGRLYHQAQFAKESPEKWLQIAQEHGHLAQPRPGKKVWTGSLMVERERIDRPRRIVFEVIEHTIDATGQMLMLPALEVETYWASLADDPQTVIALYKEHATMEQFHSEIKSELDLERLPSGKFATNSLVLHLGMMAYNLLRLIGQESLKAQEQPLRRKVARRRLRTVIQNLITLAARVLYHARSWKLAFGSYSPWYRVFRHVSLAFST